MKKKIRTLLFVAAVSMIGMATVFANPVESNSAVGVSILGTTENGIYGLQFQHWFNNRIGMQTEGFAYYNPESTTVLNYSIAGELLVKLYETKFGEKSASNLFAWFLAGHRGYIEETYEYKDGVSTTVSSGYCPDVVFGLGFGFDIMFLNHISIPIQFGFFGEAPNDFGVGFAMGTGIRYRF
jgi:hypothetical protein